MTTIYSPREDRIQLLVEVTSGEVRTLWLTRRLMDKLVKSLLKTLEAAPSVRRISGSSHTAQEFSQTAAVSRLQKQEPVMHSKSESSNSGLVTALSLHRRKRSVSVDFKIDDIVVQTVSFGEERLRQWLGVIHSQYRAAEWSAEIWPSWMRLEVDSGTAARLN